MKTSVTLILLLLLCGCGQSPAPASTPAPGQVSSPVTITPDESAAIASLREINQAQTAYFEVNRRYALAYDELTASHFLREEPTVSSTGYDIRMRPSADAASYTVSAIPAAPSSTARHLFMDKTGAIHAEQGKAATAESPQI